MWTPDADTVSAGCVYPGSGEIDCKGCSASLGTERDWSDDENTSDAGSYDDWNDDWTYGAVLPDCTGCPGSGLWPES